MERKIDITVQVIDGKADAAKYIHLHPRLLLSDNAQHNEDQKYKARDDMYSVGMIMWELWTGVTPFVETGTHNVNNGMLDVESKEDQQSIARIEIWKYLSNLKPDFSHFFNEQDSTTKLWWEMVSDCLSTKQNVKAGDWLNKWKDLKD